MEAQRSLQLNLQQKEILPDTTSDQTVNPPSANLQSTEPAKGIEKDDSPPNNDDDDNNNDDDKDEYNDDEEESGDEEAVKGHATLQVKEEPEPLAPFVPHAPSTAKPLNGFSRPGAGKEASSLGATAASKPLEDAGEPSTTAFPPEQTPAVRVLSENTLNIQQEEEEFDFNKEFDDAVRDFLSNVSIFQVIFRSF